jgi:hypothetical protein
MCRRVVLWKPTDVSEEHVTCYLLHAWNVSSFHGIYTAPHPCVSEERFSETSVNFIGSARRHIPEDGILQSLYYDTAALF